MINYPASLKAVGGARTGIAPVNLLEVQDVNGALYFWADRPIQAPSAILASQPVVVSAPVAVPAGQQVAWALPQSVRSGVYTDANGPWGAVDATLTRARLQCFGTLPTQPDPECWVYWQDFVPFGLPPNAVISAVYPVLIVSYETSNHMLLRAGAPLDLSDFNDGTVFGGVGGEGLGPCSGSLGALGEYSGGSLGASLSTISQAQIFADMWGSTVGAQDDAAITSPALAIYYSVPGSSGASGSGAPIVSFNPWLLEVPQFTFNRSLQTNMGNFVLQNLSGDTLARDFEKIMRRSALEGAFFVYRLWQPDAQAAWLEVHGTLTVDDVGVDKVTLKGAQSINPAQDDTPLEQFSETCQLNWAQARCGSTQATECQYSFQTCQVVERIMVALNSYEKNYGDTQANVSTQAINRLRKV